MTETSSVLNSDTNLTEKNNKKIKSIKGWLGNNYIYLISLAIPLVLFVILFAVKHLAPFGHFVYLPSDMYHQYCPFLSELWYKFHNGGSLLYTWDVGLGTNFAALYAYYLSSPLNFFILFFPHDMVPTLMDAFIIIKMMVASLFFTIYIVKHFNRKNILVCIFAMFYAMSGYIAAYAWNIMWLDCVAVFPLIMLGLEILVYRKKPFLFIVSLGLSVLFNYYISIMIIISIFIYFICLMFAIDRKAERYAILKRIALLAISGVIAAGISAILLLPEVHAFSLSASSSSTFPSTFKAYHSFLQIIARHMTFSPSYTWLEHYPNIYCSIFIIALLPIFFMAPKISAKEKIIKGIIMGIFLFSFMFNIPEYIWHGFHFPNCIPARQSFVYIFFVLTMGYEVLIHRKAITAKSILISVEVSIAYLAIMGIAFHGEKTVADSDNFNYSVLAIIMNAVFLAGYFILLFFYSKPKQFNRTAIIIALFGVSVLECAFHMNKTGLGLVNYTEYKKNDANYENAKASIENQFLKENDEYIFYRLDQYNARTANDGAWYGYKSVNTFSSTSPAGISRFYKAFGTKAAMNSYQRLGSTEIMDSFLSLRYTVEKEKKTDNDPLILLIHEDENMFIYENLYTLPLGMGVPAELISFAPEKGAAIKGALDYQNSFFEKASGVTDLFTSEGQFSQADNYTINVGSAGHLYVSVYADVPEKVSVTINEGEEKSFNDLKSHNRLVDAGYVNAGDSVVIKSDSSFSCQAYIMNPDKMINIYNKLEPSGFHITKFSDTHVEGHAVTSEDGYYLFTIPYDKSWKIKVDGETVETQAAADAFLSLPLSAGEHTFTLDYYPRGLNLGIAATLVSIGILAVWMYFCKKKQGLWLTSTTDFTPLTFYYENPEKKKKLKKDLNSEIKTADNKASDNKISDNKNLDNKNSDKETNNTSSEDDLPDTNNVDEEKNKNIDNSEEPDS